MTRAGSDDRCAAAAQALRSLQGALLLTRSVGEEHVNESSESAYQEIERRLNRLARPSRCA